MALDIFEYQKKYKDFYGDSPIQDVAQDAFTRFGYDKKYPDFNSWANDMGITPHIEAENRKLNPTFTDKLRDAVTFNESDKTYVDKDRGIIGDIGSRFARGLVQAVKGIGGAMRMSDLDPNADDGLIASTGKNITDWASRTEKLDILKPDLGEVTGQEGFLKRGLTGAVESIPASLLPMAGGVVGFAAGGPVGAVIGAGATLFGTFGLGEYQNTYDQTKKQLLEKGTPAEQVDEMAHKNALTSAVAETGGELVGDLAALVFFGPAGKIAAKQAVTKTIKELVSGGGVKEFLKAAAKTMPFEAGSEAGTAYFQTESARKYGLTDMSTGEAMAEAILPAVFMSLIFGGGIRGMQAVEAHNLYKKINSQVPEERKEAVISISQKMEDKESQKAWLDTAGKFIQEGKEIPLSQTIVDFASQKAEQDATPKDVLQKQKIGAEINNIIANGLTTGTYQGKEFTPDHAIEYIRMGQQEGAFTEEDIDNFKDKYPALRNGLNGVIAENVTKKISQAVTTELTGTTQPKKFVYPEKPPVKIQEKDFVFRNQDVPNLEPSEEKEVSPEIKTLQDSIVKQEKHLKKNSGYKGAPIYDTWANKLESDKQKLAELTGENKTEGIIQPEENKTLATTTEAAPEENKGIAETRPLVNEEIKTRETDKGVEMYSVNQPGTYQLPTLTEVQEVFKGQDVKQLPNGAFHIKTQSGAEVIVSSVNEITPSKISLNIGYSKAKLTEQEVIAGKYTSGMIDLVKGQADKWTLAHESVHFMEDRGLINENEVRLLRKHIKILTSEGNWKSLNKEDIGGAEDRAEFLAQALQKEPHGLIGRIINKINDFVDKLVNAFGIRTVRGITRDVKSGAIYSKETAAQREANLALESAYSIRQQTENLLSQVDKYNIKGDVKDIISDIGKTADDYLGAISTRLGNIHPAIKQTLRRYEMRRGLIATERINQILPFLKKVSKMSAEDKAAFDLARKNSDTATINLMVNKYGLGEEYQKLRTLLDTMYNDATSVGIDVKKRRDYHPRLIKDTKGFLDYFYEQNDWPIIQEAIRAKETEFNRYLDDIEKAQIINTLLRGYSIGNISLSRPGQLKERTINEVTPEINKFYANSDDALITYINRVTDTVEASKLFGKFKDRSMPLFGEKPTYRIEDTIGGYVLKLMSEGKITAKDEQILKEILSARFNETGTRGIFTLYKNFSYADTMGSPISAITQVGDLAWAIYRNGLFSTLSAAGKAITGRSRLRKEDLGIERIATEFSDMGKSAKMVSMIFKLVGLEKMDNIGKEALINSSYEAARKKAASDPEGLRKKLEPVFGNETDQLIQDLKNNIISENVKLYLFNELSDFQPISLSEMPIKYLTGGNGRIFYMLKSFTLKQFDVYRREVFQKIGNEGTRTEGIRNLVVLAACFIAANAGADELKDLLLGRKTSLEDRTVDNLLRLFGISKFVTWKARQEGVGSAMVRQIAPPFKAIDALTKDIATAGNEKGLQITQSIPIVGNLYYWWFGKGQSLIAGDYTKNIKDLNNFEKEIKEKRDNGEPVSEYLQKHPKARHIRYAHKIQYNIGELRAKRKLMIKRGANETMIKAFDDRIAIQMKRLNELMK